MEAVIDANVRLDYIEFQIFPRDNRYDAFVCYSNKEEKVTSGLLEHLLPHSPETKALHSKGSTTKYRLSPPKNADNVQWFTKSTLIRFLHIIGSSNIVAITNSVKHEMSQLEEARRFHVSIYAKGIGFQLQSEESDSNYSDGTASTSKEYGSDASKNELLRAFDLRLAALEVELTAAFDQAAGARFSLEEMTNIAKFSDHFGSIDLRDSFHKYIELMQRNQIVNNSSSKQVPECDRVIAKDGNIQRTKFLSSEMPVKYGSSPAKAAQVERQSSTEGDESFSSEEEKPSVERSRTRIRSASPRRSASPMRRVQVGRSGSRRSTAITIKSLNYIPARERSFWPKDQAANDSDEEEPVQAPKKIANNVQRMSVQDAINLFENKKKDETVDVKNRRALLNASIGANKSVLRRWSSGMGEDSSHCPRDIASEDPSPQVQNNSECVANTSQEAEVEVRVASDHHPIDPCELDIQSNSPERRACSPSVLPKETLLTESTYGSEKEKVSTAAEWSRQKEAELNELLTKMKEAKPVKSRNVEPDSRKRQSLPAEKRGGLNDHYKEKRDEKLQGETVRKRAEKDKQFKANYQVLDASKSKVKSANASDAGKKQDVNKFQNSQKNVSQPANSLTKSPKVGAVKKASTKASSLPATRKSWPSMPLPRAPGESPAKTSAPTTSTGSTTHRRSSQPAKPVSRSSPSPKVETSEPRIKSVKTNQVDKKKTLRSVTEKKHNSVTKHSEAAKNKVHSASEDSAPSAKPSLYSKVTKKGSVVPLESKPFLRKGSGTFSGGNSVVKAKASSNALELVRKSEVLKPVAEIESVSNSSEPVIQHQESEDESLTQELNIHTDMDSGTVAKSPQKCEDESFSQIEPTNNDIVDWVLEPELKADIEEESSISPTAWVEIEEHEDHPFASDDPNHQVGSPAFVAPVGLSSPRVRHSLSQMLLQEISEPDNIDWGNAENPPPMIYQKDAPKGLKRLLNFARKSKTDTNSTGWSTPSVFSEGEDDSKDSKLVDKRNAENLLKKATLHSKNNAHQPNSYKTYQKNSTDHQHPAQSNIIKFNAQSLSQQLHEGHASASAATSKATRSFFSLSAFKGSK